MIKKCSSDQDLNTLINYIGNNYRESIYLYLDAKKYGISNSQVSSWIQMLDGNITSVALLYHTGMHIFSKDKKFDVKELEILISENNPSIICAEEYIINSLAKALSNYKFELGYVAQCLNTEDISSTYPIRVAKPCDYIPMAKMLLSDEDIGASYSLDEMVNQIDERIKDGYSRSYCMFDGDRLIAQASTGAEESGVATIAYVMTDLNYRGQGLGKSIVACLSKALLNENFDVFLVYYSEEAGRLYLNHGYKNVCRYGKLYKDVN